MAMKKYIVKDSVYGDFGFEASTPDHYDDIRIKQESKIFRLFYSFESDKTYKEIMDDLLHNHLNLPDLVSATIGSRWTSYQIDLYEESDKGYELVGQSGEKVHEPSYRERIFQNHEESFHLLKRVIRAQIGYSSRRRNRILTALNLAGISGQYWEIIHMWTWNAMEWFLRGLANRTGFTPLFKYKLDQNEKETIRELFQTRIRNEIRIFKEELQQRSVDNIDIQERLNADIERLTELAKKFNIRPSIMEIFDQCFDFLKESLDEYIPKLTDNALVSSFSDKYSKKENVEALIRSAKKFRDGFVHDEERERLGLTMFDKMVNFRRHVSVLLLVAMTRDPVHYDEVVSIDPTPLPKKFSGRPPSKSVNEGIYRFQFREADGSLTSHEVEVDINRWNYETKELEIAPKTNVKLGQAFGTVTCSNMEFVGVTEISEDFRLKVKVHRWYYV